MTSTHDHPTPTAQGARFLERCRPTARRVRRAAVAALMALAFLCVLAPCLAVAAPHQTAAAVQHEARPPVAAPAADASAAPAHATAQPGAESHAEPHAPAHEEHAESIWSTIARYFNFLVLVGALWFLLRSPIGQHIKDRGVQVRSDLKKAVETRDQAAEQLLLIDRKLADLPAELDALARRGREEIAAEEARLRDAADAERQRMLDQARREIDTQLRVAERELRKQAADLAVDAATRRVKQTIADQDQWRLIDRYVTQVRA